MMSRTILRWAKENECELVISAGIIFAQDTKEMKHSRNERKPHIVYGAASTESTKQRIINSEITTLELYNGSVAGIPALLLNEGASINFDVIVLLGKTQIQTVELLQCHKQS